MLVILANSNICFAFGKPLCDQGAENIYQGISNMVNSANINGEHCSKMKVTALGEMYIFDYNYNGEKIEISMTINNAGYVDGFLYDGSNLKEISQYAMGRITGMILSAIGLNQTELKYLYDNLKPPKNLSKYGWGALRSRGLDNEYSSKVWSSHNKNTIHLSVGTSTSGKVETIILAGE